MKLYRPARNSWTQIALKTVFCLSVAAALAFAGNSKAAPIYAKHPIQECHDLASVAKTAQASRSQGISLEQYIALVMSTIDLPYYQQMYIGIGTDVYSQVPQDVTPSAVYDAVMHLCLDQQPFI